MKICSLRAQETLDSGVPFSLELGAGGAPESPDDLSVDSRELPGVDIVANLNEPLDLIDDDRVQSIYSRHTLEHIENLTGLMHELHRICIPDAQIKIVVPHFSNAYGYSDPTHVRFFGLYTMDYFQSDAANKGRQVPQYFPEIPYRVESVFVYFYPNTLLMSIATRVFEKIVNRSARTKHFYERWLSSIIRASEIHYQISVVKVDAQKKTVDSRSSELAIPVAAV